MEEVPFISILKGHSVLSDFREKNPRAEGFGKYYFIAVT